MSDSKRKKLVGWAAIFLLVMAAWSVLGFRATLAQNTDSKLEERIARLAATAQAEEGVRAAKRLHHTYSHYLEAGMWSDLVDLFTENASVQFRTGAVTSFPVTLKTGRADLRQYFMSQAGRTALGLAEGQLNTRLEMQPIVNVAADGRTVLGTFHEVALLGKFGESASWYGGIYENEYTLENGVWKISKLHFSEQYAGDYAAFGHKAPPKWDVPYHFKGLHVGLSIPPAAVQASMTQASKNLTGSPAARLAQLEQRIQRMNDETAVQNLQHSYGYYLDRKLWDDVADLFADDGSLEIGRRGVYTGKARIRRAVETIYGPTPLKRGELFDHLNFATVATISADGKTAGARTLELAQLGMNEEYARWESGTYETEFVKQNGIWKIRALRFFPRMATDFDKGWGKDAKQAAGASAEFPPDRPSTHTYESYPKTNYVGLHYTNPVTGKPVQYPAGAVTTVTVVKASSTSSNIANVDASKLEAKITELERMLNAAIAVDAVENLNSSYGYYLDESDWDSMADTFAVTVGAKEISGAGVYIGRERIRAILNLRGPRGGRGTTSFTIHQLAQPVIHVSDDGKKASARLRLFQLGGSANGSSGSWIGGIYENTALLEDGEWKFGVQDLHHTFNAPYRNGWAKYGPAGRSAVGSAARAGGLATQMPPDHPIRARQYAFPEIDEIAFHYKNPVSGRVPKDLLPER
jgi:hypothetical protein